MQKAMWADIVYNDTTNFVFRHQFEDNPLLLFEGNNITV